jgi:hypothetical protein
MRRLVLLALTCASMASTVAFAGVADAAPSKTYVVTRTVGPFSGTAPEGERGFPQSNGEADVAICRIGDTALSGSAKIVRKTSHGTARHDVLRLGKHGVYYDEESGHEVFYQFITQNGSKGWNSVKLTVTCRRK